MARPTKLTPELQQGIVDRIAAGNYPEFAAGSLGIGKSTYYVWMKRGRKTSRGRYREFMEAVKKAKATDQVDNVVHIKRGLKGGQLVERKTITRKDGTVEVVEKFARGEWQAGAWLLERKYPDLWGQRQTKEQAAVAAQIDELRRRIDALSREPTANSKPSARLHQG
jgi:hypothetical protein